MNFKDSTMPFSEGLSARITVWAERLFFAAILLLPFNDFPYFRGVFREMGAEAAFFPLALGVFAVLAAWMTGKGGDVMPGSRPFFWIKVFLAWILITTLANAVGISEAAFKGRTGWERNLLQTVLIGFCFAAVVFVSWVSQKSEVRQAVPKWALLSLLVPGAYSALEITYMYGVGGGDLLRFLSKFVSYNAGVYFRLHSVAGEPSWFAIYCTFVFPWILFSLVNSSKRVLPFLMLISAYFVFMVVLTFSRTAYFILLVQFLCFIAMAAASHVYRGRAIRVSLFLVCCIVLFGLIAPKVPINDGHIMRSPISEVYGSIFSIESPGYGMSNSARYGGQWAMLGVWRANPIFGVGMGQAGFHVSNYIPKWLSGNPEAALWVNPSPMTPWPPSHGLHARVLAELGFFGFSLWVVIWIIPFSMIMRKWFSDSVTDKCNLFPAALVSSISGLILVGFVADSFRFMEYWLVLGLCFGHLSESGNIAKSRPQSFMWKPSRRED